MSVYDFVGTFVDPNNIFIKNNYVYVKENKENIQGIKSEKKTEEKELTIKAVTPAEKQTEIAKTELAIETDKIKQPDSLDTSQLKGRKRKAQVYDSLS